MLTLLVPGVGMGAGGSAVEPIRGYLPLMGVGR